jgi:hypothetical protein
MHTATVAICQDFLLTHGAPGVPVSSVPVWNLNPIAGPLGVKQEGSHTWRAEP